MFLYLFGHLLNIKINVDICWVNYCSSNYILLNNLDNWDKSLSLFTYFSVDTHTSVFKYKTANLYQLYSYLWLSLRPNIFGYSFCNFMTLRIYSNICSVNSLVSQYIRIFVWSILGIPLIFGYFFCQFLGIQVYLDIHWDLFHNICPSLVLLITQFMKN